MIFQDFGSNGIAEIIASIISECDALPIRNTPNLRQVRRKYSALLRNSDSRFMYSLVKELIKKNEYRWFGYELLQAHPAAFRILGEVELEVLGHGIDSWWTTDAFARTLSGPLWLSGQISDEMLLNWSHSPDHWWRRAALVSTVALNVRSHGGKGDTSRTLIICHELVGDRNAMVAKALSWALRELVAHDPQAVDLFLTQNETKLAPLVKREVRNKLLSGKKYPNRNILRDEIL